MISPIQYGGRPEFALLALAAALWVFTGSSAMADDVGFGAPVDHAQGDWGLGTLGYGGYGLYPGYPGFALKFHPGYGYGGQSLGVGAFGGYPGYGGPGYPHKPPPLRRCGKILPFYYNGVGVFMFNYPQPSPGIGPLVIDRPVVGVSDRPDMNSGAPYNGDFGPFTGAFPYPETYFAPYTSAAGSGSAGATRPSNRAAHARTATVARDFGIAEERVADRDGGFGVKVLQVYPDSAAEKAGLQPGDVILSANGYRTERPGNVAWIIANAARDDVLKMNVRKAKDSALHSIDAPLG
jgi:membrane-associated protease RseP (regulator of RpoE activity)